ncbi:MAG: RNA pseudouridine synthase [Clostridia bacterium]|nr:RNA pseudouridine synthase [Clostridia bacterium]
MKILFENDAYWIVRKPAGIVSEANGGHGLADLLAAKNDGYAGVIHRLDREVGGVTVYAKTPLEAARLSALVTARRLGKEYLAAVSGVLAEPEGELRDLLYYDRSKNKVYAVRRVRRGVKEAVLRYRTEAVTEMAGIGVVSLLAVEPLTGRTHQIRVQFASRGHAVVGDRRYGGTPLPAQAEAEKGQILLSCRRLVIPCADGDRVYEEEPAWKTFFWSSRPE